MLSKIDEAIRIYMQGNVTKSIQLFEDYMNNGYQMSEEAHYYMSLAHFDSGNIIQSLDCLMKAIELRSDCSKYYYRLGLVYSRLAMYHEAVNVLKKSLEIAPNNNKVIYTLGKMYLSNGELDDAIKMFEKINHKSSEYASAMYSLGLCNMYNGQLEKASADFEKTISVNDEYTDAFVKLGQVYFIQKRYSDAVSMFSKAYEQGYNDSNFYISYALALCSNGGCDKGYAVISEAFRLYKADIEVGKIVEVINDIKKL